MIKPGFTLLEMLVVLLITSLISMLLMQGLGLVLHLRSQFINQIDDLQIGAVQEYWFRSSSGALFPGDDKSIFNGETEEFYGLTLAAINADIGQPLLFKWEIIRESEINKLYYYPSLSTNKPNEPVERWLIMHWTGIKGGFQYMDAEGNWHNSWQKQEFSQQRSQLPQAILFTAQRRQYPIQWLVKVMGVKDQPDLSSELKF